MTTLITGGTVVSPEGATPMDVVVEGETDRRPRAAGLARSSVGRRPAPTETIDATGMYVMPGGVDVHTHMELPFGGTNASDTFETGTARPPPGAAPRRSSTSPCSGPASGSWTGSRPGTPRPRASAPSTTAST